MFKQFHRVLALLLVPCLVAGSVSATVFHASAFSPLRCSEIEVFSREVLALEPLTEQHPRQADLASEVRRMAGKRFDWAPIQERAREFQTTENGTRRNELLAEILGLGLRHRIEEIVERVVTIPNRRTYYVELAISQAPAILIRVASDARQYSTRIYMKLKSYVEDQWEPEKRELEVRAETDPIREDVQAALARIAEVDPAMSRQMGTYLLFPFGLKNLLIAQADLAAEMGGEATLEQTVRSLWFLERINRSERNRFKEMSAKKRELTGSLYATLYELPFGERSLLNEFLRSARRNSSLRQRIDSQDSEDILYIRTICYFIHLVFPGEFVRSRKLGVPRYNQPLLESLERQHPDWVEQLWNAMFSDSPDAILREQEQQVMAELFAHGGDWHGRGYHRVLGLAWERMRTISRKSMQEVSKFLRDLLADILTEPDREELGEGILEEDILNLDLAGVDEEALADETDLLLSGTNKVVAPQQVQPPVSRRSGCLGRFVFFLASMVMLAVGGKMVSREPFCEHAPSAPAKAAA